eukprot:3646404-Amphidinium_carterae.1
MNGGGICAPQFALSQIAQMTSGARQSGGYLFVDIAAAYDSVIRQFIAPHSSHSPLLLSTLVHLGLHERPAEATLHHIKSHPACLLNLHLPEPILAFGVVAWFWGS